MLSSTTSLVFVGIFMFVLGSGLGTLMQNLVLVVQNSIDVKNLGVATSGVTFFRSLGGAIGVAALGSVLGTLVADQIRGGIGALSPDNQIIAADALGSGAVPHLADLPGTIRLLVEASYGQGAGMVFLLGAPLAVITLVMVSLLPNIPLGTQTAIARAHTERQRESEYVEDIVIDVSTASVGLSPAGLNFPTGSIRVIRPETEPDAEDK
jgi:hypothetical protein